MLPHPFLVSHAHSTDTLLPHFSRPSPHLVVVNLPPPHTHSPELKDLANRLAERHTTCDPVVVAEQRKKRNYAGGRLGGVWWLGGTGAGVSVVCV